MLNVLMKNMKNIFLVNKSVLFVLTLCLNVTAAVLKIYVMNVLTDSTGLKTGVNVKLMSNVLKLNTKHILTKVNKFVLSVLKVCLNVTYVT